MQGELFEKSSPCTPSKTFAQNISKNKVVSAYTDSRREVKPRFCCRERLGSEAARTE